MGSAEEVWLSLLRIGKLSETPDVSAWVVDKPWIDLLEGSADDRWEAWLHRGVMRYYQGNISDAQTAFEISLARKEARALRCPVTDEIRARVREAAPPPPLDFRQAD